MVLAPLSRVALDPDDLEQLDKLLHAQNSEVSFLRDLKCRKPRKTGPTLVNDSSDSVNRSAWSRLALFCLCSMSWGGEGAVAWQSRGGWSCSVWPELSPVSPVTWWWWTAARQMLFLRGRSLAG